MELKFDRKRKLWVGIDAIQVPTSGINVDRAKQFLTDDKQERHALAVEMAITHAGFINLNKRLYLERQMSESTETWLKPHPKPVIRTHDIHSAEPIGRMYAAEYRTDPGIGASVNAKNVTDDDVKKFFETYKPGNKPTGHIYAGFYVTDADAIDKWLDGRYQTVSVGFTTNEMFCSVCGENFAAMTPEEYMEHEHVPGKDDCYLAVGRMEYDHLAVVNLPADEYVHVASMKLSRETFGDSIKQKVFYISKDNKTLSLGDEAATPMSKLDLTPKEVKVIWPADAKSLVEGDAKKANYLAFEKEGHMHRCIVDPATGNGWTDYALHHSHDITNKVIDAYPDVFDYSVDVEPGQTRPILVKGHKHTLGEEIEPLTDSEQTKHIYEYVCDECLGEVSEEDTLEAQVAMEDEYPKIMDELLAAGKVSADAKLSAAQRKKLAASTFCGPGRSFPVPDCDHYTAALRLLGRYKGSAETKAKIHACVNSKGKKLGCTKGDEAVPETTAPAELTLEQILARQDIIDHIASLMAAHDEEKSALNEKITTLTTTVSELTTKVAELEGQLGQASKDGQDKQATIDAQITQNTSLFRKNKSVLVDNIILRSLIAKSGQVYESIIPGATDDFDAKVLSVRTKLMDETTESLTTKLEAIGPITGISDLSKLTPGDFRGNDGKEKPATAPAVQPEASKPSLGQIYEY